MHQNWILTTAFCSTRAFTCSTFPDTTRGKMDESAPLQNSRHSPETPQTHTHTHNKNISNKLNKEPGVWPWIFNLHYKH